MNYLHAATKFISFPAVLSEREKCHFFFILRNEMKIFERVLKTKNHGYFILHNISVFPRLE